MGRRGPLPQKSELRLLKGEGRRTVRAPQAVVAVPDKPADLGPDASRVWDMVVPELVRLELLSRLDGVIVEAFCRTYEMWLRHDGGRGFPALTATLTKLAKELGLSPGSRLRLPAPETDDDEEWAVFGGGRPKPRG